MSKILIFGAGWLGGKYTEYLDDAELVKTDITDKIAVAQILDEKKPEVIINTAGKTGRPNIDWCEDHKAETIESNITGPLVLAKACADRNIMMTHLSSGCIFDGTAPGQNGFTEKDKANPVSFYSFTKATTDEVLAYFDVLILRLRMPVDSAPGTRNLISKLASYKKIIDVENSVTVVDDLMRATKELIEQKKTGIYNITNPGSVRHSDIMKWYCEIVDANHKYEMVPLEELKNLARTGRSNCILDTTKLESAGIKLQPAEQEIKECLSRYAKLK